MKSIRLLFLDDEKELVDDLKAVLEVKGFDVTATSDVKKAMQLFSERDFDVVLTDIAMPPSEDLDAKSVVYGRETGVQLARRMRGARPDVPIVALTVIRDPNIISRMKKVGISRIVHKPAECEEIVEVLRKLTGEGR